MGATSGVFLVENKDDAIAVFKPTELGNCELRAGLESGGGTKREIAAYAIDSYRGTLSVGVPFTTVATTTATLSGVRPLTNDVARSLVDVDDEGSGSLQKYVKHVCSSDDVGPSLLRKRDVHKLGIFDLCIFNLDRHGGNILVTADRRIVPIDHALCLPPFYQLDEPEFSWMWWPQCKLPFDDDVVRDVGSLSVARDAALLRALHLPRSCVLTLCICESVLKRFVRHGLTLFEIASVFTRTHRQRPSELESMIRSAVASIALVPRLSDSRRDRTTLSRRYETCVSHALLSFLCAARGLTGLIGRRQWRPFFVKTHYECDGIRVGVLT